MSGRQLIPFDGRYDHDHFVRTFSQPSPGLSASPFAIGVALAAFTTREFRPTVWLLATAVLLGWVLVLSSVTLGLFVPWLVITRSAPLPVDVTRGNFVFCSILVSLLIPTVGWEYFERALVELIRRRALRDAAFFQFARDHSLYTVSYIEHEAEIVRMWLRMSIALITIGVWCTGFLISLGGYLILK